MRSVAQFAVSTYRAELDLDADVFGVCTNAEIFRFILNNLTFDQLIWEFGDQDNLIGCTLAMSAMVLIVEGASRLAETKRVKYIMNRFWKRTLMKEEDFDDIENFLDQDKLKKQEQKIESGEITCNLDNPEDCESCSG